IQPIKVSGQALIDAQEIQEAGVPRRKQNFAIAMENDYILQMLFYYWEHTRSVGRANQAHAICSQFLMRRHAMRLRSDLIAGHRKLRPVRAALDEDVIRTKRPEFFACGD